jgi:hypothetical protein
VEFLFIPEKLKIPSTTTRIVQNNKYSIIPFFKYFMKTRRTNKLIKTPSPQVNKKLFAVIDRKKDWATMPGLSINAVAAVNKPQNSPNAIDSSNAITKATITKNNTALLGALKSEPQCLQTDDAEDTDL